MRCKAAMQAFVEAAVPFTTPWSLMAYSRNGIRQECGHAAKGLASLCRCSATRKHDLTSSMQPSTFSSQLFQLSICLPHQPRSYLATALLRAADRRDQLVGVRHVTQVQDALQISALSAKVRQVDGLQNSSARFALRCVSCKLPLIAYMPEESRSSQD